MTICGICGEAFENQWSEKDFYIICKDCLNKIEELNRSYPEFAEMMKQPIRSIDSQGV